MGELFLECQLNRLGSMGRTSLWQAKKRMNVLLCLKGRIVVEVGKLGPLNTQVM